MKTLRKVLFVHSAHYDSSGELVQSKGWFNRLTTANVEKLGFLLLAALTPKHIQVQKVEEYFQDIPWDTDADVIGIHAQVMQLKRACDIAREFRRRGKIVVMGGFLPTMHPELVQDHVDALCVGEGELVWPEILKDIEAGTLKKIYKADRQVPVDQLPVPRYDLVDRSRWAAYPVQATRGCPFTCDYCSIIQFYEKTYRLRPIDDIIRDIRATKSKVIYFTDDNLMENKMFAKELFRAMKGLGVEWGTQCTINIAKDEEMLRLAYEAGCRFVAVGVESLSQRNLQLVSKDFNRVDQFGEAFQKIHRSGIAVHALMVFGFAEDTPETFDQTVEYLEEQGVALAEFFIFTPYPKTPAGQRVFAAGQVVDTDLSHFRETYVVFKHPKMSSEEIVEGYWRAQRKFYSFRSMFMRTWRGTYRDKLYHFVSNLYYWLKVKRGIVPVYFGKGNEVPKRARRALPAREVSAW